MIANIVAAQAGYEDAAKHLLDVVTRELPVGAQVRVTIGRGVVEGTVIRHGSWWSDPGYVQIRNNHTQALRKFHAPSSDVELL